MSVATTLRIDRDMAVALIADRWQHWVEQLPALAVVEVPHQLDRWLRQADREAADQVLRALARLAAADGYNDIDAAVVLIWVMLPATIRVARSFSALDQVDEHVAAQMWIEARSFNWRAPGRVAPLLQGRLRRHLAADLWSHDEVLVADPEPMANPASQTLPSPFQELLSVLEDARVAQIISEEDRTLLLDVIAAADAEAHCYLGGGASLFNDRVSDAVAIRWGVSGRTVRRRASASVEALTRSVSVLRRTA